MYWANQPKNMIYDNISTSCKLIHNNFGNSPPENLSYTALKLMEDIVYYVKQDVP